MSRKFSNAKVMHNDRAKHSNNWIYLGKSESFANVVYWNKTLNNGIKKSSINRMKGNIIQQDEEFFEANFLHCK